ncbi:hypothetical protein FO441_05855 [Salinicoccus cyprini]|uniref:Uncharacterized protein n=2 Tax=Staphylococcaceae TaxID=90964 RepID=A0A558AZZ0_9STAP|nr:hypothetical protein FO441_05855 [Salinicoccus cyprini]
MSKHIDNTEKSYFVEEYDSIEELLSERGICMEEFLRMIDDPDHKVISGVPVVAYENLENPVFKVGYLEDGMTPLDILEKLKSCS